MKTVILIAAAMGLAGGMAQAADAPAPGAAEARDAAAVMTAVTSVCLPILQGQPVAAIAKAQGLKKTRDGWMLPIEAKRHIDLDLPGGSNPHVCAATVVHTPGDGAATVAALAAWAAAQVPPLNIIKDKEQAQSGTYLVTASSWSGGIAAGGVALSYAEQKLAGGKPVAGTLDQATLAIVFTPAAP